MTRNPNNQQPIDQQQAQPFRDTYQRKRHSKWLHPKLGILNLVILPIMLIVGLLRLLGFFKLVRKIIRSFLHLPYYAFQGLRTINRLAFIGLSRLEAWATSTK